MRVHYVAVGATMRGGTGMIGRGDQVLIEIEGDVGADTEELTNLARLLRDELLELDILSAEEVPGGVAPPGARGLDAAVVGQLIVELGPVVVRSIMQVIRSWLNRSGARRVAVRIDGDEIILDKATREERESLLDFFIARHSGC